MTKITIDPATVEQAIEVLRYNGADNMQDGVDVITALRAALEQPEQEPEQRSDGMPHCKTERQLRRLLCVQRHSSSAYMDDGEASFGGDEYCRSIDYMRESVHAIELAWQDAGIKKLAAAKPEQEPPTCAWLPEDDDTMPGTYRSACGELWIFIEGGWKENRVRFCHGCGGKVVDGAYGIKEPKP